MDKYGLVRVHNPYAKFIKSIILGLILIFTGAVSVTSGFFGLNQLTKNGEKEETVHAISYTVHRVVGTGLSIAGGNVTGRNDALQPVSPTGSNPLEFPSNTFVIEKTDNSGYAWVGWYTAQTGGTLLGSGPSYSGVTSTVYARWNVIVQYTVTLNPQSGTNSSAGSWTWSGGQYTRVYNSGSQISTFPTTVRTGYTFGGWWTAIGGTGTQAQQTTTVTGHITYYAYWTVNTYTVTLDRQISTGGTTSVTATYGSNMPTAYAPSALSGWTGDGYFDGTGGSGKKYYNQTSPGGAMTSANTWDKTANTTLYYKWTATITFQANGGSIAANASQWTGSGSSVSKSIQYNSSVIMPTSAQISRGGYTFNGWNTNLDGTGSSYVSGNSYQTIARTLYAQWGPIMYSVLLYTQGATGGVDSNGWEYDGGMGYFEKYVAHGQTVGAAPTNPTKTGHTFVGWNTHSNGAGAWYNSSTVIDDSDIAWYAYWVLTEYEVAISTNGGTGGSGGSYSYSSSIAQQVIISHPSRTGYTLSGYTVTGHTGSIPTVSGTTLTIPAGTWGNLTLTANWTAKQVTVSLYTLSQTGLEGTLTINAGSSSGLFNTGATITIAATTNSGFSWSRWFKGAYTDWNTIHTTNTSFNYTISAAETEAGTPIIFYAGYTVSYNVIAYTNGVQSGTGGGVRVHSGQSFAATNSNGWGVFPGGQATIEGQSNTGYSFDGWYSTSSLTTKLSSNLSYNPGNFYDVKTSTFYANWTVITYTVTYNSNKPAGASGSISGTTANTAHTYNVAANLRTNGYSLTGWIFAGWATTAGGAVAYSDGASVSNLRTTAGTYTLYAKWTAITYTVVFNGNGNTGGSMSNQTHTYDSPQTLTANAYSRTGYTFNGWNTAANGSGTPYTNSQSVSNLRITVGTVDLFAQWTAITYTVAFNGNGSTGGSMSNQTHTYDSSQTLTSNAFTRTGYTFANWNTEANGSGTPYNNGQLVSNLRSTSGTFNLYAQWTAITYTVVFNGNDNTGGSMSNQTHTYGSSLALTANAYTRTGYTFANWNTAANGSGATYTNNQSVSNLRTTSGNFDLYAQWTVVNYTITLDANGGSGGSTNPTTYNINPTGSQAIALTHPERTGYTRSGYTITGASGGSPNVSGSTLAIPPGTYGNLTVTANWTINSYTVTLYANGGTGVTSGGWTWNAGPGTFTKAVTHGSQVGAAPTNPTRTGYTFGGWFEGLDPYNATTPITSDLFSWTASWSAVSYSITIAPNGGGGGFLSNNIYNISASPQQRTITHPTRTSHTLNGYVITGHTGTIPTVSGTTLTIPANTYGNLTLTAQWIFTDYIVSFQTYGGTTISDVFLAPNTQIDLSQYVTTRDTFEFNGWYANAALTDGPHGVYTITSNMTFYAKWVSIAYWTASSARASSYASGAGTEANPYIIRTAAQLGYFSYRVSQGNDRDAWVKLDSTTGIIDIDYYMWWPIGNGATTSFRGVFDGNNNRIINLRINKTSGNHEGLFGYIADDAIIRNVGVEGNITINKVNVDPFALYVGGIVAFGKINRAFYDGNGMYILNSYFKGNIDVNASYTILGVQVFAGGITGSIETATLDRVFFTGGIIATQDSLVTTGVGGIAGRVNKPADSGIVISNAYTVLTQIEANDLWRGAILGAYSGNPPAIDRVYKNIGISYVAWPLQPNVTITNATSLGSGWETQSSFSNFNFVGDWVMSTPGFNNGWPTLRNRLDANNAVGGYIIQFNANGGTLASGTVSIAANNSGTDTLSTALPANPTPPTHYTFAGWSNHPSGSVNRYSSSLITANETWYARWTPVNYTITLNAQGGTGSTNGGWAWGSPSFTKDIAYNTQVGALPTAPTRTNYTFDGWWTAVSGGGAQLQPTTVVSGAITYHAKWTYTVTFNGNSQTSGAPSVPSIVIIDGLTGTLATQGTLAKTHYTYGGWNTNTGGTGTAYATGLTGFTNAGNIILYAKWNPVNYTITLNAQGGTGSTNGGWAWSSPSFTKSITYDTQVGDLPTNPTRTGYTFAGWWTSTGGGGTQLQTTTVVSGTATYHAHWTINTYSLALEAYYDATYSAYTAGATGGTVKINSGATGATATANIVYNTSTSITATPATGFGFAGWYTTDGTFVTFSNPYNFNMPAGNTTYHARFLVLEYTVTFEGNGHTGGSTPIQSFLYNQSQNLTANGFTKTNATFAGWSTVSTGGSINYANGASYTIGAANVTLYARWNVNISFDKNDAAATGTMSPQVHIIGIAQNLTTNGFSKAGHTFAGWAISSGGAVVYANGASYTATEQATLFAKWTQNNIAIDAITDIIYNNSAKTPNIVVRDAVTNAILEVNVHYNNIIYTNNINAGTTANVSVTGIGIYASKTANRNFTIKYPAITFNGNVRGTISSSPTAYPKYDTVNYYTTATGSTAFTAFPVPTSITTGYTFLGYSDSSGSTTANYITYNGSSFTVAQNWDKTAETTILYAIYTNQYNVNLYSYSNPGNGTYENNTTGGSVGFNTSVGNSSIYLTITYNTTTTMYAKPATGYTFLGWYASNLTTQLFAPGTPDGNGVYSRTTASMPVGGLNYYAKFETTQVTITVTRNSTNGGTVSASANAYVGSSFNISATNSTGWRFRNWTITSGTATITSSTSASTTLTGFNAAVTVRANFERQLIITVFANTGTITPTIGGAGYYLPTETASLSASTVTSHNFAGWGTSEGGTQISTSASHNYSMPDASGSLTIYANYTIKTNTTTIRAYNNAGGVTAYSNNSTGGTVGFSSAAGSNNTNTPVNYDASITIYAKPEAGYTFAGWYTGTDFSGAPNIAAGSPSAGVYSNTINNVTTALNYNAKFTANTYTLTAYKYLDGYANTKTTMGTASVGGTPISTGPVTLTVAQGQTVSLVRTVQAGFTFDGWFTVPTGGTAISTAASYNLTFNYADNATIYARYRDTQNPSLSVSASPETTTVSPTNTNVTLTATYSDNYGVKYITNPDGDKIGVVNDGNMVDYTTWNVGQTTATGWSRNGVASDNIIVEHQNPWGQNDIMWASLENDATSDADGGFESSYFAIDNTQYYRFSIWINRSNFNTSSGTSYFGFYTYNSSGTRIVAERVPGGTTTDNPYFYYPSASTYASTIGSDVWALWVGYVIPYNSSIVPGDSGVYNASGAKLTNISFNYKWNSTSVSALIRSYLYYSTDTTEQQYFYRPRVDLVSGAEPSLQQLLAGYEAPNVVEGFTKTGNITYQVTQTGTYTFVAEDYAGNITTVNKSVYIDKVAPVITVDNTSVTLTSAANINAYNFKTGVTASDTNYAGNTVDISSSVVATYFKADGTTSITESAARTELYEGRNVVVKYNVADAAGNTAEQKQRTVSPQMYTVTFMTTNSPTLATYDITHATRTILAGETINGYTQTTMPSNPSLSGYTFEGWNTATAQSSSNVSGTTAISGNVTWYSAWTPINYTLTVYASTDGVQSGTGGTVDIQSLGGVAGNSDTASNIPYYTSITVIAAQKTGYSFIEWNTLANGTGTQLSTNATYNFNMPAGNTTYYAIFNQNFTLTLRAVTNSVNTSSKGGTVDIQNRGNAANASDTANISYGSAVRIIAAVNPGYTFLGWYDSQTEATNQISANLTYDLPGGMPFGHRDYYAWFLGNEVTINTMQVNPAGKGTANWNFATTGTQNLSWSGYTANRIGVTITVAASANAGYSFVNWTENGNGNVENSTNSTTTYELLTTDTAVTFTANFTPIGYTLTLNANNGTITENANWTGSGASATKAVIYDAQIGTIPTLNEISRNGYTFAGWKISTIDILSTTVWNYTSNQTADAQWTAISYTITIAPNNGTGGSSSPASYNINGSSQTATITHPTRTGYTLSSYTVTGHTGTIPTVSGTTLTIPANTYGNLTLTAQWTAINYTITVVGNGGTAGSSSPATYNISGSQQTTTLTHATRTGYTLDSYTVTGHTGSIPTVSGATLTIPANTYGNLTLTPQWTAINYTITVAGNGGTAGSSSPATYNISVSQQTSTITHSTRTGYTLSSYTVSGHTGTIPTVSGATLTIPANTYGNLTLTPQWTPITYTVVFNGNGHTSGSMSNQTFTYDTSQNLTANTYEKTGYTFANWNTVANGSGTTYTNSQNVSNLRTTAGTFTLYAQWTAIGYTLTLNANNGTIAANANWTGSGASATKAVTYDAQIGTIPTSSEISRTGYTFAGWKISSTDILSTTVWNYTSSQTADAQWTAISYTITVAANGGTAGSSSPATYNINGSSQTATITHPTRTGYTLNGYIVSGHTGTIPTVSGATLTIPANTYGNLTLTAQWTAINYTITVAGNGGTNGSSSPATYNISTAQQTTTLTHATRTGYTLDTYTVTGHTGSIPTVSGTTLTIPANTYGNLTLTAQWTAITYTVLFNGNGNTGGSMTGQSFTYDIEQDLTANTYEKTGYTFANWNTVANGSGATYEDEETVINLRTTTGNFTLYAQWTPVTYTLTLNANNGTIAANANWTGSGASATKAVTYDAQIGTIPTSSEISRTGYTFAGWKISTTDISNTTVWNYTSSQTADAQWTAISYTITIAPNNGTGGSASPASYSINTSQQTSTLTHPTRTGYTLSSYTVTGHTGTIPTVSGATLTIPANTHGNLTLTANWTAINYTITVAGNGGTNGSSSPATYNISTAQQTTTLTHATRTGYTLSSYTVTGHTGSIPTVSGATLTIPANTYGNLTLTSQWTPIQYTVVFNGNGHTGGSMDNQIFTYDESQNLTANAYSKTGYTFASWNTVVNGSGTTYTNSQNVSNLRTTAGTITLYAQWTAKQITVSLYTLSGTGEEGTLTIDGGSSTGLFETGQTITILATINSGFGFGRWFKDSYVTWSTYHTLSTSFNYTISAAEAEAGTELKFYAGYTVVYTAIAYTNGVLGGTGGGVRVHSGQDYLATNTNGWGVFSNNSTAVEAQANTGYTFDGWYSDDTLTTKLSNNVSYNPGYLYEVRTSTFYGNFVANQYTVIYNPNKPTNASSLVSGTTENSVHTYDQAKALTMNAYTLTGWTFVNWNTVANGSGTTYTNQQSVSNLRSTAGDFTLYAQWSPLSYTLTLNANNGTIAANANWTGSGISATKTVTYDAQIGTIPTLSEISRTGYTFAGWKISSTDILSTTVWNYTSSQTADAQWTPISYTITVAANGGTGGSSNPASYNISTSQQTTAITHPTRTGYTVSSYTVSGHTGTIPTTSGTTLTIPANTYGNLTLTANWAPINYLITLDAQGGTGITSNGWIWSSPSFTKSIAYDSQIGTLPTNPERAGYTFSNWWTNTGGNGTQLQTTTVVSGAATYYANWTPISYTITVAANGGTGGSASPDSYNISTSQQTSTITHPTRTGYNFSSYTVSGHTGSIPTVSGTTLTIPINTYGNLTLTANWTAINYTITVEPNGGTGGSSSPATYNISTAQQTTTLTHPTRTGYTIGSYTVSGHTGSIPTVSGTTLTIPINTYGNLTLTAQWTPIQYTVVFNGNGNTSGSMSNQTFTYDTAQNLTENAYVKTGYVFINWNTQANGEGVLYADGESVINLRTTPGNFTLYAQWQATTYTIIFDKNDPLATGSMENQTMTFNVASNLRALGYSKNGYSFAGWAISSIGAAIYDDEHNVMNLTSEPLGEVTLYAKWAVINYTITYVSNSPGVNIAQVTHSNPATYTINSPTIIFTAPTYVPGGYEFLGWVPTQIVSGSTGNVVVTAQFMFQSTITINVTFDETVEPGTVSFLKLVNITNNSVWMFVLVHGASYNITLNNASQFQLTFINTTNHTTSSNISEFAITQSGTNTTSNIVVSRSRYGYIYNTKFVQ